MDCEFCGNNFKTKYTLKTHQTKSKYCLELQNKNIEVSDYLMCKFCKKGFTVKHRLLSHHEICKDKIMVSYENKIKELEQKLSEREYLVKQLKQEIQTITINNEKEKEKTQIYKDLSEDTQQTIKDIAKQPKTQNIQNNKLFLLTPMNMDENHIKQIVDDSYTEMYFHEGQKGIAKFAYDKLLKDSNGKPKYICTDPARHIFKYKDADGDIKKDFRARKLTNILSGNIIPMSHNFVTKKVGNDDPDLFMTMTSKFMDINNMTKDNTDLRLELVHLTGQ